VYYPDEGHWIDKQPNALHWWGEFLGWLDRWI
jgi:dipeptidyl aminopeptidase/acylaminoacyl peptidase